MATKIQPERFAGKRAIVTGASAGIGHATATRLAAFPAAALAGFGFARAGFLGAAWAATHAEVCVAAAWCRAHFGGDRFGHGWIA